MSKIALYSRLLLISSIFAVILTVVFFVAYGVGPCLNVGFEEALFLANKMKGDLGATSNISTEKVLYLLFLTLKRKNDERNENNENVLQTFKAFIIRYLYYLRE